MSTRLRRDESDFWHPTVGGLRCEAVNPSVHRDVVDLDAALRQEFLDCLGSRPNRGYHRTARVMASGGKRYPAKAERGVGLWEW
jgi:hypothetical protein